jgi:hypothetical protein
MSKEMEKTNTDIKIVLANLILQARIKGKYSNEKTKQVDMLTLGLSVIGSKVNQMINDSFNIGV